jgi:hypothetical protein
MNETEGVALFIKKIDIYTGMQRLSREEGKSIV